MCNDIQINQVCSLYLETYICSLYIVQVRYIIIIVIVVIYKGKQEVVVVVDYNKGVQEVLAWSKTSGPW